MRSKEEQLATKGKVVVVSEAGGKLEEVRVSVCSRSICFYSSSSCTTTTTSQQETTAEISSSKAGEDDETTRPPSVPRSRWLFPEEDLPVLQWRRPRRCGVGLGNPHALCFMNAVLQALAYTPGVADDLLEGRHSSRCPLAASTAAARRHARMLIQQRSSDADKRYGDKAVAAAKGKGAVNGNYSRQTDKHQQLEGLIRRTRAGGGGAAAGAGIGGVTDSGDGDAAVSFCLLCKLEEQIQSIHCACPAAFAGQHQQQQQGAAAAAQGVVRGFVRNRFSRYVKQFVWRRYREGRQEDAHEFLRYLLDALMRCGCSTSSSSSSKRGGAAATAAESLRMPPEVWLTSYFGQLFGGWLQSSVSCNSCGYCSRRFDACLDLPLDLTPAPATPGPWPAMNGGTARLGSNAAAAAAADATAGASSGKRRFNSSSSRSDYAGEGGPASKVVKRKVFAASSTAAAAAEAQCSASRGVAEIAGSESHHHDSAAAAAASRRIFFAAGGRPSGAHGGRDRKKKSQLLREGGGSTIEKALQHFVAQEYLTGDNSYSCPQCKQKRPATKQLRVYTPPRVLVLPIKRFAVGCWGGAAGGSSFYNPFAAHSFLLKNQAPVAFPAVLNLAPYMVSPTSEVSTCVSSTSPAAQIPCSITMASVAGYLKKQEDGEEEDGCMTAAITAGCSSSQQQEQEQGTQQQSTTSLKLQNLSTVSERQRRRRSSSGSNNGTGKEDEASPRSDDSIHSTSTRASSSSPSPSPSRGGSSSFFTGQPQSCSAAAASSVSTNGACSGNDTFSGNTLGCPMPLTSPSITTDEDAANLVSQSHRGSPAANNDSVNSNRTTTTPSTSGSIDITSPAGCSRRPPAPPLYQLYAVVTHTGSSLSSGHYRCFVRAPASAPVTTCKTSSEEEAAATASASMWLLIDDEVVQTVSETFVLQRLQHDAYLLFYSRIPSAQQQQELLLKEEIEKQQHFRKNTTVSTAEQRIHHHQGGGCRDDNHKHNDKERELMEDGDISASIKSSRQTRRSSLSTDSSNSLDDSSCHSTTSCDSSNASWGTGSSSSSSSGHSDESSASSNSSVSSDNRKWSDDDVDGSFRICTRRTSARLRNRQYAVSLIIPRAHLGASRKNILSFMQQQKKLQQAEGSSSSSSTYLSYGKKFRTQRLLALQVSLLLRRGQRQSRVDAATTTTKEKDSQLEGEEEGLQQSLQSHHRRNEEEEGRGPSDKEEVYRHDNKEVQQQKESDEGRSLRANLKGDSVRSLRILSTEEMRGRMKAACSFANQYGVANPGEWSDEEECSDETDERETDSRHLQSLRQVALERLQELQQPRRQVRNRHDREYDRGKVKKVKTKLSTEELTVGEAVIVKSRDGDSTELVVHQRAAFDSITEQQKQPGSSARKAQFHAKKQQRQGRQRSSGGLAKQNWREGRKYGQGKFKRKLSDK